MSELLFYLSLFLFVIGACVIVVARFTKAAPKKKAQEEDDGLVTFETIMVPLEFPESSYMQLQKAVDLLFKHYHELNLTTTQKRFFLYQLSKHPRVKADLVLFVLNDLSARNPDIAKELESSVKRGLDRRDLGGI